MTSGPSYRDSHIGKGTDYQNDFSADVNPHRAMVWNLERRALDRLIAKHYPGRQPKHLDFACGTGRILGHLHRLVASSTGVDISPTMLEVARSAVPQATIYEADLTASDPIEAERFDLVTAFRFFPNAEPALRSAVMGILASHLAEGGRLIFNNHKNERSLARRIAKMRGNVSAEPTMTRQEVDALLAEAGLEVIDHVSLAALPLTEQHMPLPVKLAEALEGLMSLAPGVEAIAQNTIYVATRK
jgi:predicted TPR repeat methyltransferase